LKLGRKVRLKVTDVRNLRKLVQAPLRMKDSVAQTQDWLFTWKKNKSRTQYRALEGIELTIRTETSEDYLIYRTGLSRSSKDYRTQHLHRTITGNCQGPEKTRSTKRSCARYGLPNVGL
jgi:hypothetical protein